MKRDRKKRSKEER
jgi:hypothetical protein